MSRGKEKTVLFLCTGNYYRSRYAEIVFNAAAAKLGLSWKATSRGLALERGVGNVGPIAAAVIEEVRLRGLSAGAALTRMPMATSVEDLKNSDRVIALKWEEHEPLLSERFSGWAERVEYWHIDDAPGVLGAIEQEVHRLIARLLGTAPQQAAQEPTAAEVLPTAKEAASKAITLKVGRETAGRRGKGVTTVFDIPLDAAAVQQLAATLKQRCGTGGTIKEGRIEIQGDQRERIVAELEKLGYRVKRVGG